MTDSNTLYESGQIARLGAFREGDGVRSRRSEDLLFGM